MKITDYASNKEVLCELGKRIKDTRIAIPMTQKEMAKATGLGVSTVSAMEQGKNVSVDSLIRVLRVLSLVSNFDILIPEQGIRPSQIMELGKKRERATSKRKADVKGQSDWKWGDEK